MTADTPPPHTPTDRSDIVDLIVPMRRYARALTRDVPRADDLVHDALVRALEAGPPTRPGTNLRTWMMTVLHNVFVDDQRRKRVEARHAEAAAQIEEGAAPPAQEGQVRLAQIRQAFQSLPEEQRAALHLVTLEGMAYAEAAAVLAIPIGTLMSRLGRGRAALRAFEEGRAIPSDRPRLRLVAGAEASAVDKAAKEDRA